MIESMSPMVATLVTFGALLPICGISAFAIDTWLSSGQ